MLTDGIDDAIAFFLPELARDRDTSREIEQAHGEFLAIGAEGDIGKRYTDLSFSVPIKGGDSRKVSLFLEQQDEDDLHLPLRMFQTFYRMSDSLKNKITALAIFTGRAKDRSEYLYSCYGVNLSFKYNTYHVLSHDITDLKNDERVFAPVILAARMVIAAKGNPLNREKYVRELLKIINERDYDIKRRRRIMKFIANVLKVYNNDISEELKEEFYMKWIPTSQVQENILREDAKAEYKAEGKVEGKAEGKIEGKIEIARSMLADGLSPDVIKKYTGYDKEDILAYSYQSGHALS